MNYVRFKKRILLTWTYNFLLIGALLSDYDLLSLSDLDNLTLYKLDYINE